MGIDFDEARWERVKDAHRKWWAGELDRPLIYVTLGGRDPGRPEPSTPRKHMAAFYDLNVPAADIVDRWDWDLSCLRFAGDSFPHVWPNFGPGVAAAFMGAELHATEQTGTVWFHPARDLDIRDIHLEYDPDNVWLRRIKDISRTAVERWRGLVQVGMTDLGGNLDLLSTFRPSEKLLLDLYDYPDHVKRLTWEAHELWWRYFEEITAEMQPLNAGYSSWYGVYSEEPSYVLQCDFCYMIGPDQFDEFVKPELAASCKRMANGFYHLDGPGQLPHLDSLLTIAELKGVQWVYGEGNPPAEHWPEVYRKIRAAGKYIDLWGPPSTLDWVTDLLGSGRGIVFHAWCRDEDEARALLDRYGAD